MTNEKAAHRASQQRKGSAAGKQSQDVDAMLRRRAEADQQIRIKVREWCARERPDAA